MVRRSDEGCSATQKLDFLRSRQMLAQDHILSPALLSIGLNRIKPVPKAQTTAPTTPKGRSETQKNPMKKTRKYASFQGLRPEARRNFLFGSGEARLSLSASGGADYIKSQSDYIT